MQHLWVGTTAILFFAAAFLILAHFFTFLKTQPLLALGLAAPIVLGLTSTYALSPLPPPPRDTYPILATLLGLLTVSIIALLHPLVQKRFIPFIGRLFLYVGFWIAVAEALGLQRYRFLPSPFHVLAPLAAGFLIELSVAVSHRTFHHIGDQNTAVRSEASSVVSSSSWMSIAITAIGFIASILGIADFILNRIR